MMILQLTRLSVAVLATTFHMGNAYNNNQDDTKFGGVLEQEQGMKNPTTATTVERRSLLDSNIFQVFDEVGSIKSDYDGGDVAEVIAVAEEPEIAAASKSLMLTAASKGSKSNAATPSNAKNSANAAKSSKAKQPQAKSAKKRKPTYRPTAQPTYGVSTIIPTDVGTTAPPA